MLSEFEREIVACLKEVCPASPYLGEFESAEELELLVKENKTLAFVDFKSERYQNTAIKRGTFEVHILGVTSSKSKTAREENKLRVLDVCETIDKKLQETVLSNEFRIETGSLAVRLNQITNYGYIYILTREITTDFLPKGDEICER